MKHPIKTGFYRTMLVLMLVVLPAFAEEATAPADDPLDSKIKQIKANGATISDFLDEVREGVGFIRARQRPH